MRLPSRIQRSRVRWKLRFRRLRRSGHGGAFHTTAGVVTDMGADDDCGCGLSFFQSDKEHLFEEGFLIALDESDDEG